MKKLSLLAVLTCMIVLCLCGCTSPFTSVERESRRPEEGFIERETQLENQGQMPNGQPSTTDAKIAVVYFSATGNTRTVAEFIKQETNADIYEIVPAQIYTDADLTWTDNNSRATKEQNDKTARPEIQNEIDLSAYHTIFLGYPIWFGDCPRIVQTFIETNSLNGKTVIPFCTSGSSGISGSENTLKQYNEINWQPGKRLTTSQTEVTSWVQSLALEVEERGENEEVKPNTIILSVNQHTFTIQLEENEAVKELMKRLDSENITVEAHEYGGFEKVGSLGFSLPTADEQITTQAGDIVLYQGNQVSLFYHANSWNYTKLGRIENVSEQELIDVLGDGNVTLVFSK